MEAASAVLVPLLFTVTMVGFMGTLARVFLGPSLYYCWVSLCYGWARLHLPLFSATTALRHVCGPVVSRATRTLSSWVVCLAAASLYLASAGTRQVVAAVRKLAAKLYAWNRARRLARRDQQTARRQQPHGRGGHKRAGLSNRGVPGASGTSSASSGGKVAAQPSEAKSGGGKRSHKAARSAANSSSLASTSEPPSALGRQAETEGPRTAASVDSQALSPQAAATATALPALSGAPPAASKLGLSKPQRRAACGAIAGLDLPTAASPPVVAHAPAVASATSAAASVSEPEQVIPKQQQRSIPHAPRGPGSRISTVIQQPTQQQAVRPAQGLADGLASRQRQGSDLAAPGPAHANDRDGTSISPVAGPIAENPPSMELAQSRSAQSGPTGSSEVAARAVGQHASSASPYLPGSAPAGQPFTGPCVFSGEFFKPPQEAIVRLRL